MVASRSVLGSIVHHEHTTDPGPPTTDAFVRTIRETGLVRRLLELARDEDLGDPPRDLTGESMFAPGETRRAALVAREPCVAAGLALVPDLLDVFVSGSESVVWTPGASDADRVDAGAELGTLEGSARAIVRLERPMLNLLARLSGVATLTARFVARAGDGARVCDTRKTTPGLRVLEKYAVRCGGGTSHRMGLYDALLIKDNHLAGLSGRDFADRIVSASCDARARGASFVQIEVDTPDQLDRVLAIEPGAVDIVLLDNMDPETLAACVARRDAAGSPVRLEASGGVTESTIDAIARSGVDRVSAGALTHQARSVDLGLDAR